MRKTYCRIAAFIDWNPQLRLSGIDASDHPLSAARAAFKNTARRVAACLHAINSEMQFKVDIRLYNGWHKGYEPSQNRKAIKQVIAETDFLTLSSRPKILFSAEIGFGDCLLSALPDRMHSTPAIHLPNTLRDQGHSKMEEKMVDTALASDLIVTAYQEPETWILVAAEDDDVVPPIFVAEAIIKRAGSRVLLLSSRRRAKNFLKLEDISVELR